MTHSIEKKPKTEWLLVKVPHIRNDATGSNATARMLRETIRDNHFGGEKATVSILTKKQIEVLTRKEICFSLQDANRLTK